MKAWFRARAHDRAMKKLHRAFSSYWSRHRSMAYGDKELAFRWFWELETLGPDEVRRRLGASA